MKQTEVTIQDKMPSPEDISRFRANIIDWYSKHGRKFPWRKRSLSCYAKVIAELLLQRTRAETVAVFYPRFIERFPSWSDLERATSDDLEEFLQPIGLWRRRAESMRLLARELVRRGGRFPKTREDLESLPGIGQYMASAILLLCHNQPQPLLDANMARVLECFFGARELADIRYDPYLQCLAKAVVSCKDPVAVNWAILDYASLVCGPKIRDCSQCRRAISVE